MQKNGYFQLDMQPNGIFIKIFAPVEGGNPINIAEVIAYLDKFKYNQYDLKELNKAVTGLNGGAGCKVAEFKGNRVDEEMYAETSLDKMMLTVRFYPASNNGRAITLEDMMSSFQKMGITAEIDKAQLEAYLKDREYCKTFTIAKGKAPIPGKDARIVYFFNTDHNLKPKRNEDGSVNYKE